MQGRVPAAGPRVQPRRPSASGGRSLASTREVFTFLPIFAALMPLNGAASALDGILIGAGDTRYPMKAMVAASAVCVVIAPLAPDPEWGIRGVWAGLAALLAIRALTLGVRFAGDRWALVGVPSRSCSPGRWRFCSSR